MMIQKLDNREWTDGAYALFLAPSVRPLLSSPVVAPVRSPRLDGRDPRDVPVGGLL